ncbi:hypothetical protein HZH66_009031 [Vespula vulgaris]|uniref:separase n=1 Tax=Vespula vulgaris TaxID=7454 RepID=A0A834N3S2_VESVU|nr:separin [Vespula vulgaris]KAF7393198.1 hypothetical protein HZH66_009031 [Vespula vulgaris]
MDDLIDDIMHIIHKCHPTESMKLKKRCKKTIPSNSSLKEIQYDIEQLLANKTCNAGGVEYSNLNKMMACCNLKAGEEVKAIYNLSESHAIFFRQQITHRFLKNKMRERILCTPQIYGLKFEYIKLHAQYPEPETALLSNLVNLPEEWYIVQVTAQFEDSVYLQYNKNTCHSMHALHITILPTGNSILKPLCITLPKPQTHTMYDICNEIREILGNNKSDLTATYANKELYWKMRLKQDNKMKTAVHELEFTWLREWRILFMADFIDNLDVVADMELIIDKLIADCTSCDYICPRTKWLLKKISLGACFLTREEIARAVKYVLCNHEKLAENVILSIYGKLLDLQILRNAKRKTLVLIIDEHMDFLPFESIEILKNNPVTRFSSIYVAYALFKQHENTIKDGCKIIKAKDNLGTCIVNPSGDLYKMEKRLELFINYWLTNWKSLYNTKPEEGIFEDALVNYDILMYNGHGSGIQYLPGEHIEKLKVKAIVLLFGCNSIRMTPVGGRFPPYGITNQYLIASSPCVLGMQWEVTDSDIDKMTASFISTWIPSSAERSWSHVDIDAWCQGNFRFLKDSQKKMAKVTREPEMLRAISKSKEACSLYMTAASIVTRGLPIKLE